MATSYFVVILVERTVILEEVYVTGNQLELRSIKAREEANSITSKYNEGMVTLGNRNAAETKRHNEQAENLSQQQIDMQDRYNNWFMNWQDQYTAWEEEYKENSLKMQYANEAEKRKLEERNLTLAEWLAEAQKEKAEKDAEYTTIMGGINQDAQDLKERVQDWNEFMQTETLNWSKFVDTANIAIQNSANAIRAESNYINAILGNENVRISDYNAETNRMNAESNALNAKANWLTAKVHEVFTLASQMPYYSAQTDYLNSRTDLADSEKFRNYGSVITSALGNVADLFGNLADGLTGFFSPKSNPIGFR